MKHIQSLRSLEHKLREQQFRDFIFKNKTKSVTNVTTYRLAKHTPAYLQVSLIIYNIDFIFFRELKLTPFEL